MQFSKDDRVDYVDYRRYLTQVLADWECRITYGGFTPITVSWLLRCVHKDADITHWENPTDQVVGAFQTALEDLIAIDYIKPYLKQFQVQSTKDGRAYAKDPELAWRGICERAIDHESEAVLQAINDASEVRESDFAYRTWITFEDISHVTKEADLARIDSIVRRLFVDGWIEFSGSPNRLQESAARATHDGLVWTTRRDKIVHWKELDALLAEGETCTTEFKQKLVLKSTDQKCEFVKDILGLVNTQASGKRRMIIGIDDKTRRECLPSDPTEYGLTQQTLVSLKGEQLDQILSSYTDPPVRVSLKHIQYRRGPIAVIEVFRETAHMPYRVSRDLRGGKRQIRQGSIFVRHGTVTEPPTPAELVALESKGREMNN